MNRRGITVGDLLKNTYAKLIERNPNVELTLLEGTLSEIANDSDWHRTRIGYMHYEKANLFTFDEKIWAIGKGEKYGSYPAELYDSDILALELRVDDKEKPDEQLIKEIAEGIKRSSYFENSLVFGYADGNLGICKSGRFGKKMEELLIPKVSEFIAQKVEYDERYILASTLQYPTTKEMLYKPSFAGFLTETIENVLKEENNKKEE